MKLTTAFVLFCAISATFAIPHDSLSAAAFTSWMHKNGKTFHHDEFQYRYKIWSKNNDWINAQNAQGNTYTLAMNEFGHLTPEEFRQHFNGLKVDAKDVTLFAASPNKFSAQNTSLPASLDWREQGAVTPIKNQGQCGSCWSFSTTGSFEGCHFLKNKELVSFSEQNLVDCSGKYGNEGCNGGLMTSAMDYIIANGGLDTEASYPYKAVEGTCQYDSKNNGGTLESYQNIPSGDEGALQQALAVGPVSVAIDASHMSFQFYKSGVYTSMFCSSENLDHGVLAVGWGTDSESKKDYWIVKNSWGTTWGLEGYILMARNDNNMCGIATMATLPSC